jgi:hypothetical protein
MNFEVLYSFKIIKLKRFKENRFAPRPLGFPLTIPFNGAPAEVFPESLTSQNPRGFSFSQLGLLPHRNSDRGEEKGWCDLPVAREVRWRAG